MGICKDELPLLQIAFWWLVLFTVNCMQKSLLELCIMYVVDSSIFWKDEKKTDAYIMFSPGKLSLATILLGSESILKLKLRLLWPINMLKTSIRDFDLWQFF